MQKFFKSIVVAVLTWEAQTLLRRHKPFIIAVTGSVGKTTTKDAIFHVLKDTATVRKSEKGFNSEFGVPLTILGLPTAWGNPFLWAFYLNIGFWRTLFQRKYPKLLVLEIGADHPGDISRITSWLRPNIAVITLLPERPVHVEFFPSPEEVRKEKWKLTRALKEGGTLVLNGDDSYLQELRKGTNARVITFGFGDEREIKGSDLQVRYGEMIDGNRLPIGMTFRVNWKDKNLSVDLSGVLGSQPAMAILAALAVGEAKGESMERMTKILGTLSMPLGRMRIIPGKGGSVIIDDSYNSSPIAAEAAIETLRTIDGKRKIAMLGDMLELGEFTEEEHRKVGRIAGGFVNMLITVGKRAEWIADGAKAVGLSGEKIHKFRDSETAGKWMAECLHHGDIVLVKGSQGSGENMIRMERAVKRLMLHPEDAATLLVRQEDEWQRQYPKKE